MKIKSMDVKVSFVIIAFNEERNISICVDSILNQSNLSSIHEIILVNDGSTDGTASVMSRLRMENPQVKIIDLKINQGRGAARASGVEAATGGLIAFVDADIILPTDWLVKSLSILDNCDACGGIAIPDGDVAFVYALCGLRAKIAKHPFDISGGNCLLKRKIFDSVSIDTNKRNGEDIDLIYKMKEARFTMKTVPDLFVEHHETKSYKESIKWLYEQGIGSSLQFFEHPKIRTPDIAFFIFVILLIASVIIFTISTISLWAIAAIIFLYISACSFMHLRGKFDLYSNILRSAAALLVNNTLLFSYYVGRIVGSVTKWKKVKVLDEKKVMVFFDFEGKYGMPYKNLAYDINKTTDKILATLDKYNVKATFFVVGALASDYPAVVSKLAKHGHIVGLHGYEHENSANYSAEMLDTFSKKLTNSEENILKITGVKPNTFRSPYLMAPKFYSSKLYELLKAHGFTSVSNREIRYQQEIFHPSRLRLRFWLGKNNAFTKLLSTLINLRLLFSENVYNEHGIAKYRSNLKWLLFSREPFFRKEILEIPIYSPLDCDLIGLPKPNEQSSEKITDYTLRTLEGGLKNIGRYYSLNFHDWIIGTQNRINILDEILKIFSDSVNVEFITCTDVVDHFIKIKKGGSL